MNVKCLVVKGLLYRRQEVHLNLQKQNTVDTEEFQKQNEHENRPGVSNREVLEISRNKWKKIILKQQNS